MKARSRLLCSLDEIRGTRAIAGVMIQGSWIEKELGSSCNSSFGGHEALQLLEPILDHQ